MKKILYLLLFISFGATAQTVGIKVASPIIKNNPSDNTVTGYADLLNGGYHITPTISGRDSLNTAYSKTLKTGMLCYVTGVDSTYRWDGTVWNPVASGGISLSQLTDSLQNYTPLQDGLISGGSATIGTGSVTIDTAYYRINKVYKMSLPRTFTGISNSASGTQYYILVYGKTDNTLDTLQGVQDTIATIPTRPNGTASINTILVGDGGVEQAQPDLSGYAKLSGGNTFVGAQLFKSGGVSVSSLRILRFDGQGATSELYNIQDVASTGQITATIRTDNGGFAPVYNIDRESQIFNFRQTPTINGVPIGTGSSTPDSTVYRTVANSYSLASGQPRLVSGTNIKTINSTSLLGSGDIALEVPLTFGYGATRTSNTITADTTSGTGLVSKTRLTGALGSKLNTNGSGASLTNVVNSITGTTNQVVASSSTGAVTLSLPQSINTTSTPQFSRMGLGGASSSSTFFNTSAGTTSQSSFRIPNGVAPTTPVSGDWWSLTTGLRTQTYDGTQTKDVIFDKVNIVFAGYGVGAIVTDNSGNLSVAPSADRTLSNKLSKTANYTITLSDFGANGELILEVDCTVGAVTITLPSLANMTGVKLMVFKVDSSINAVTISGAVNINGSSSATLATQWASTTITGGTSVYLAK